MEIRNFEITASSKEKAVVLVIFISAFHFRNFVFILEFVSFISRRIHFVVISFAIMKYLENILCNNLNQNALKYKIFY